MEHDLFRKPVSTFRDHALGSKAGRRGCQYADMRDGMGDAYPVVKVAAVQAASVFLNREGSTEKACRLIREAGAQGARVIAFPESFIPAHPVWYHHHAATGALANRLSVELFKNAVEIPGREVEALGAAAHAARAYVVIGVCEKIPNTIGTMFNTQLYIGPDGVLIRKHQKIMPTVGERLVHTGGHGDTFGAFASEFGPMSGLICGENSNPLAVFALTAEGTRIHVMSWPNHFPMSGDPMKNRVVHAGTTLNSSPPGAPRVCARSPPTKMHAGSAPPLDIHAFLPFIVTR